MSAYEFLIKLLPRASHPEIAVIVLTGLSNPFLLEFALKNGALAAFHKTSTSGDMLDAAILKAIATIRKEKTRQDLRESLAGAEPVSGLAREQLKQLTKEFTNVQQRSQKLYEAVEKWLLPMDSIVDGTSQ
jgi:DNA-binding NarL/FixJ family response regulator